MKNKVILTACIFGLLAVICGAFGAHALKAHLTATNLEIWHTAVQYQFYHVFALLFLATFFKEENRYALLSYYFFSIGIVLFSGSIYLLACRELLHWDWLVIMGPITPIGGLLFILGWIMMALAALKKA